MIPLPVGTAVMVTVGPCIDDTNFKSRETTIAYNAAGMDIDLNKKGVNSTSTVAITPTSGGANDWVHIAGAEYSLELTAGQNDTLGTLHVVGVCTGVLPFESPVYTVVPVAVYNALVAGTDKLQVDTVELGSATQSLADLKDFADTGYDPVTHKVQGVVLADTCTTNTDVRGTDSAALANVCTEARLAELAAANLPADVAAVAALVAGLEDLSAAEAEAACDASLATYDAPTKAEMDTAHGLLATPAEVNAECDTALSDYDGPTNAEMEARTIAAASATKLEKSAARIVTGSASAGTLSTTQMSCDLAYTVDDALNGRLITWEGNVTAALKDVQSDITDHEGTDTPEVLTFTAIPVAPADGDNFVIT